MPSTGGPIARRSSRTAIVTKSPAWRTSSASARRDRHSSGSARAPRGRCVSEMIATRIREQLPVRRRTGSCSLIRVAIISDTHLPRGARALPDECLSRLAEAELVLHAGDFVTIAVLDDLRAIGPPVDGIHGNMDEAQLKQLLPKQRVVEVGDVRIGMVHNAGPRNGREARLAARFADCQAVIYGHTHVPQ